MRTSVLQSSNTGIGCVANHNIIMPPNTSDSEAHISPLPQCGFGTDFEFNSLIKSNQFLYRVYTPKERSPFADETDPFFIAPRFDELVVRTPADIIASTPWEWSYADVARHMEWTTRTSSPYVSASFSFAWAIWEAVRRYHTGMKKDVEIAVIDACALDGRAATAVQLLKQSTEEERNDQFEKWYRFSHDSQSVLVYGMVPRTAVLASVPLLQILRKLPSYFLRNDIRVIEGNPLAYISWDYARRKQNFRQFCREMSTNLMGKSADVRLRDSTAGSVRLGLSFLHPFLHAVVRDHFEVAVSYLRSLSTAISEWPNGKWVNDHPEVHQIIEVMVLAVVEELRAKYLEKDKEASSLEQVMHSIKVGREARTLVQDVGLYSDDEFGAELEESDEPTLVNPIYNSLPLPLHGQTSLHVPIVIPRIPISIQTPITPPESPRNSLFIPAVSVSTPSEDVIIPASTPKQLALSQGAVFGKEEVSPFESQPPIVSNNLVYLPITPPAENVVFSHTKLETIIEDENDLGVDASRASSPHEVDHRQLASDSTLVAEDSENDECAGPSDACEINTQYIAFPSINSSRDAADGEEQDDTEDISDDGQDTESFGHVTMPVFPWSGIRQLGSPLSSRRSSIISLETLCEPIEFPIVKRLSFTSMSDSYDLVPTMRSVVLSSRTASFSGMSPSILPFTPPDVDVVVDPLPPPLLQSEQSQFPSPQLQPVVPPASDNVVDIVSTPSRESEESGEISRSISTTSSSSSFSTLSNDLILPLITPLPPSPVWSVYSLPSSISASSSSTSLSAPQTPVPHPRELSSSELGSSTISVDSFRPPGKPIGILAPLANQDPDADHAVLRRRRRVAVVSETASYVVTGFLVGAFLTLFLFSTQRKTILYVT